jgi:hypothetical protein
MTWAYDISLAARLLVATVFLVSAGMKVLGRARWQSYSVWLAGLPLKPLRRPEAPVTLAGAEATVVLLAALSVLVPAAAPVALAAGSVLCLALTVGLSMAIARGSRQPCHCFGSSSAPLSYQQVVRNALLLAMTVTGSVYAIAAGRAGTSQVGPEEAGLAMIGGLAAALLIIFFDDVAALFKQPAVRLPGAIQVPPHREAR